MHDSNVQSLGKEKFQPKLKSPEALGSPAYEVFAITSDYRRAAVKSAGPSLLIIDITTQEVLTELQATGSPEIQFSRSGALIAVRGANGSSLVVYQTENGQEVFSSKKCHSFEISRMIGG